MIYLVLGLALFLGLHSVRIVAPNWREERIAAWGEGAWKSLFSLLSIAAFALVIWGYGQARAHSPILLWTAPAGLRHAVALLTLPAFVLLVAAYVPHNHIKARLGHPMILGVKLWALAHLLVNGWLHAVLLFGGFLLWSIFSFRAARRRDPVWRGGTDARLPYTVLTVVIGVLAWAGFAFYLHARWIGVAPFG